MKACQKCTYIGAEPYHALECYHPALMKDDPIRGKVPSYAYAERDVDGRCGPDAKFFTEPSPNPGYGLVALILASVFGMALEWVFAHLSALH